MSMCTNRAYLKSLLCTKLIAFFVKKRQAIFSHIAHTPIRRIVQKLQRRATVKNALPRYHFSSDAVPSPQKRPKIGQKSGINYDCRADAPLLLPFCLLKNNIAFLIKECKLFIPFLLTFSKKKSIIGVTIRLSSITNY